MFITVFIGVEPPFLIDLNAAGKDRITFGSSPKNDIVLPSRLVSAFHGSFVRMRNVWKVMDEGSLNGFRVNEESVRERLLSEGLKIYIGSEEHSERVVFLCTVHDNSGMFRRFPLEGRDTVTIGRRSDCDICLSYVGVSRLHAGLTKRDGTYYLTSYNNCEVFFNGKMLPRNGSRLLPMDRFIIGDTQFLFRGSEIVYYRSKNGLGVEVADLTKTVTSGRKKKTIVNHVNLQIMPGEFTAIVGGSGAGKSSLMKCISGCSSFTSGTVLLQGEDIRSGYEGIRQLIGYVPQQDIVYDDLTLERMLLYSAKLRMPKDSSKSDIQNRIKEVLDMVELTGHEKTLIRKLSGGQKKRASIAVELLSDPGIFFLDEPTSGLDPGTEQSLMHTLKDMTGSGKTIVLVTHTPLNLHLCDRIIFMGPGGRLCFCGSPDAALAFFGVNSLVDIYNLLQKNPEFWEERFAGMQTVFPQPLDKKEEKRKKKTSHLRQFRILSMRYLELIANDRKKLLLQFLMAPGLGVLLYLAFSGSLYPFQIAQDTKTFSLALACCCFWIGLFQSIQEICKERMIVERERMAGLGMGVYYVSKCLVLGVLLILQCLLLIGSVWYLTGHPEQGMMFRQLPFLEYLLTTVLTAFSAAALGLLISAFAANADQAISTAPLLLIPQILFSEIICDLSGAALALSNIISCKWACLAYAASANIRELATGKQDKLFGGVEFTGYGEFTDAAGRYRFTEPLWSLDNPVPRAWAALLLLILVLAVATRLVLRKKKEL